jgi:hypothetical protein
MASQKREDPKKTPEKKTGKEELSNAELDKVAGGRKRTEDPCAGGEYRRNEKGRFNEPALSLSGERRAYASPRLTQGMRVTSIPSSSSSSCSASVASP